MLRLLNSHSRHRDLTVDLPYVPVLRPGPGSQPVGGNVPVFCLFVKITQKFAKTVRRWSENLFFLDYQENHAKTVGRWSEGLFFEVT